MAKRILIAWVALVVLMWLLIGGFALLAPRSAAGDAGQRSLPASVYFGRAAIPVSVRTALSSTAECTAGPMPLDIVVAVDQSASMDGAPFESARAGARRFIESLDNRAHRVALVLFNGAITARVGLTSDRTALLAALAAAQPAGTTAIHLALDGASDELASQRHRANTASAVVLFSDGGNQDTARAVAAANRLKAGGAQLFMIGWRSQAFNEALLAQLASRPDTLLIAPDPGQLAQAFDAVAQVLRRYAVADLRYYEPLNYDRFTIDTASLPAGLTVSNDALVWQAPALTREELAMSPSITYTLRPRSLGVHTVPSTQDSTLSYTPCDRTNTTQTLPGGPNILVAPPLGWLIGLPLALLLAALLPFMGLGGLFGRRPKPQTPPPPPESGGGQKALPPLPEQLTSVTARLRALDAILEETGRAPNAALTDEPVLIIGLGETGRTVLGQIGATLRERFGPADRVPAVVRMLQISLPPASEAPRRPLPFGEEVTLTQSINKLDLERDHLRWARRFARGRSFQGPRRPRGYARLALFADLGNGKNESKLWDPLTAVLSDCTNLHVWIVADGWGWDGSAIIGDVAHLLRQFAKTSVVHSVRLCLALQNMPVEDQGGKRELARRTYATLRELQRLQRSGETFSYAPSLSQAALNASTKGKLLDEIYLFDGHAENSDGTPHEIGHLPAELGVLRIISNALLALLEHDVASVFYQRVQNAQTAAARARADQRQIFISALGCGSIRAPIEPTRRLGELYLVHRVLFDAEDGIFGWEILNTTGSPTKSGEVTTPGAPQDVARFWDWMRRTPADLSRLSEQDRARMLIGFLDREMNEDAGLRLRWAAGFLQRLADEHPDYGQTVTSARQQVDRWIELVGQTHAPPAAVAGLEPGSGLPVTRRLGGSSTGSATGARRLGALGAAGAAEGGGALLTAWRARWAATQNSFPLADDYATEQPAWLLNEAYSVYQRYIPAGVATQTGDRAGGVGAERPVEKLRQRLYWLWQTEGVRLELRLLVLPPDLNAPASDPRFRNIRDEIENAAFGRALPVDRATEVLDRLLDSSRAYSRGLAAEALEDHLAANAVERLLRASDPAFRSEKLAENIQPQAFCYLLTPPHVALPLARPQPDVMATSSDPACCTLLRSRHTYTIEKVVSVREAQADYRADPDPELHVWEAEQTAVIGERLAQQEFGGGALLGGGAAREYAYSPDAEALLGQARPAVELVGRLLRCGALELARRNRDWTVKTAIPELGALRGAPAASLLPGFVKLIDGKPDLVEQLKKAADNQVQSSGAAQTAMREQIARLVDANQPGLTDVALTWLVALNEDTPAA